jgi:hypothetical protein
LKFLLDDLIERHIACPIEIWLNNGFQDTVCLTFLLMSIILVNREDVISLVVKSLKNPRSAVCKTAIMTSADIFSAYSDHIIDSLDPLVTWCFLYAIAMTGCFLGNAPSIYQQIYFLLVFFPM